MSCFRSAAAAEVLQNATIQTLGPNDVPNSTNTEEMVLSGVK